jgi:AraC family transcriptional regulator
VESIALEIVAVAIYEPETRAPLTSLGHAYERIRQEFRDKLSIMQLAREAGMHPVSFARAFRARYGASPGELVRRLRVEWAAVELLRRREEPIARIAADAGFYDQSHFARAFNARFGCPPARYRVER